MLVWVLALAAAGLPLGAHGIVNGVVVTQQEMQQYWRSAALLTWMDGNDIEALCSAAVILSGPAAVVVTAAHCLWDDVQNMYVPPDQVRLDFTADGQGTPTVVTNAVVQAVFPGYRPDDDDSPYDIALLNMPGFTWPNVVLVDEAFSASTLGAAALGYGTSNITGAPAPPVLRLLEMAKENSASVCAARWPVNGEQPIDWTANVCAWPESNAADTGPCYGDSGGPLVFLNEDAVPVLIGVESQVNVVQDQPCMGQLTTAYTNPYDADVLAWLNTQLGLPVAEAEADDGAHAAEMTRMVYVGGMLLTGGLVMAA